MCCNNCYCLILFRVRSVRIVTVYCLISPLECFGFSSAGLVALAYCFLISFQACSAFIQTFVLLDFSVAKLWLN